jgi:hypothetical protein
LSLLGPNILLSSLFSNTQTLIHPQPTLIEALKVEYINLYLKLIYITVKYLMFSISFW